MPEPIPETYRPALGAQVYGCDICQDVCPWNRGVERRRADEPPDDGAHVDLVAWLRGDPPVDLLARLYVPRNEPRWLLRNALVALGNTGGPDGRDPACCGATPPGRTRCSQSTRPGRSAGWRSDAAERTERWISFVRLVVLPLVLILVLSANFPDGAWGPWAAVTSAVFTVGSVVLFYVARSDFGARRPVAQSVIAQVFDTTVVIGFTMVFAYDAGLPTQQLLYVDLAAACVRFRIRGGLIIAAISAPIIALFEQLRSEYLNVAYSWELVVLQTSVELVLALLLGWLVREVAAGSARAEARAVEAEDLRDELGRRADLADAANRCARALNSSLDVPQAFGAFIRELRGLLPFDRVAIILAEDGVAKVMATAGAGVETVFPPGAASRSRARCSTW